MSFAQAPLPPPLSRRFLSLLCSPDDYEAIDGDLLEEFRSITTLEGAGAARIWYRLQVATSIWSLVSLSMTIRSLPRLIAGVGAAIVFTLLAPELANRSLWRLQPDPPTLEVLRITNLLATAIFAPIAGLLAVWISRPQPGLSALLAALLAGLPALNSARYEPDWIPVLWICTVPSLILVGGIWGTSSRRFMS